MSFTICTGSDDLSPDGDDCQAHDVDCAGIRQRRSERATPGDPALGEMAGGIVHDFRNILAVIDSGLKLAERHPEDPEKVRFCLAAAREGVGRGLYLTARLLSLAKRRGGDPQAADVNDLLRDLELFVKYGAGPGIRIAFNLAPDILQCLVDPAQFNAAVLNLVVNARDALPDGGRVEISTENCEIVSAAAGTSAPRAHVRVRVRDSGQGMSAEVARKIFYPYFTTKGDTVTGLGLSQVYASVQLVGGHVSVTSEPGLGTTFDLIFPVQNRRPDPENPLWRQVDRWVNEGVAEGDEMFLRTPQETVIETSKKVEPCL